MKDKKQHFLCRNLQWDTEYFGVKCARLDLLDKINLEEKKDLMNFLSDNEFVVITNSKENADNNQFIGCEINAFLADVNVQLKKTIITDLKECKQSSITIKNKMETNNEIVSLAKDAFKNSRFLNDKNITINQAQGIYTNWVKNSFNKDNKYFITYRDENKVLGFLLFSSNDKNQLVVELICILDSYKGKGVGKELMQTLDMYAVTNAFSVINVGTQIENIEALNFYMACGYKIDDIKYIYHYWNK